MGLRDLERAIERGVDGILGRVFKAEMNVMEIDNRLRREIDAGTRRTKDGVRVAPNKLEVRLHPDDVATVAGNEPDQELVDVLLERARNHAKTNEYRFDGPLVVDLVEDPEVLMGTIEIFAAAEASVAGIPPGTLVYPDGFRLDLTSTGIEGIVLGRDPATSDLHIEDELASRNHSLLRPSPRGWVVEDLQSTNGTRINGLRIAVQLLSDGDTLAIGATTFVFHES